MCFVCDSIAETCGWQRAQKLGSALEAYFAKWEEPLCQHCDEGLAEFVDELPKSRDQGCQAGESSLTLEGRKDANEGVRQRTVNRNAISEPGTTSPHSKFRPATHLS